MQQEAKSTKRIAKTSIRKKNSKYAEVDFRENI